MTVSITTLAIGLPDDFPNLPYNAIHALVHAKQHHVEQTFHYGGAWNAIAYRFLSCANSDDRFTALVGSGTQQGQQERFEQEEALLNFFVNGLSAIESFFYGLYWMGSMASPATFPILAAKDLRNIQTNRTMDSFSGSSHAALFTASFSRLRTPDGKGNWLNTPQYDEWKDVRNILAHRASYGRVIHGSFGGAPRQIDDVWRVRDIPINDQLTGSRRAWLAATLKSLLDGAEAFGQSAL